MQNSEDIWRLVDAKKADFEALSDRVWGMPELCYGEVRSCAEHTAMLEQQGFRVTTNVAGIPTAVMGESGKKGTKAIPARVQSSSTGAEVRSRRCIEFCTQAIAVCFMANTSCWAETLLRPTPAMSPSSRSWIIARHESTYLLTCGSGQ